MHRNGGRGQGFAECPGPNVVAKTLPRLLVSSLVGHHRLVLGGQVCRTISSPHGLDRDYDLVPQQDELLKSLVESEDDVGNLAGAF